MFILYFVCVYVSATTCITVAVVAESWEYDLNFGLTSSQTTHRPNATQSKAVAWFRVLSLLFSTSLPPSSSTTASDVILVLYSTFRSKPSVGVFCVVLCVSRSFSMFCLLFILSIIFMTAALSPMTTSQLIHNAHSHWIKSSSCFSSS